MQLQNNTKQKFGNRTKIHYIYKVDKTTTTNKMKIAVTTVTQTANEVLGVEAKNLYYLIITNDKGNKLVVNVGKKTHDTVQALVDDENKETITKGGKR